MTWAFLHDDRLRVALKVAPGSGRNRVMGPEAYDKGHAFLKITVTAAPEDGKANPAMIKLLAKRWQVAPRRFRLLKGARARRKAVEIIAADQSLLDKVLKIEKFGRQ